VRRSAISLLEWAPELFALLPKTVAPSIAKRTLVRTETLAPGTWHMPASMGPRALGFMVLGGFVVRQLDLFGNAGTELLGAGDLLTRLDVAPSSIPTTSRWTVLSTTKLAVLDNGATARLSDLSGVMPELMRRAVQRSHAAKAQLALARIHPLSTRLHVLFWNLADRWGRRNNGDVLLDVPLSHQLLADLASACRPKVTQALGTLSELGLVSREGQGSWVISGRPPKLSRTGELAGPGLSRQPHCESAPPVPAGRCSGVSDPQPSRLVTLVP
jgi:CRP-like cAMP-binding protein